MVSLTQDGAIDTGFGGGGFVTQKIWAEYADKGYGIKLLADGRIMVVGSVATGGAEGDNCFVLMLKADGTRDLSFNGSGLIIVDAGSATDTCHSVAELASGKFTAITMTYKLIRLNADGTLDNTFGVGGQLTPVVAGAETLYGYFLRAQADGKIIGALPATRMQVSVIARSALAGIPKSPET